MALLRANYSIFILANNNKSIFHCTRESKYFCLYILSTVFLCLPETTRASFGPQVTEKRQKLTRH